MSFSLKLFGGISLEGDTGPLTGPAVQRHRLAVLAVLAASRSRAISRDKLLALLWPERDAERARGLLNQAVYALRQALGAEAILSAGEELQFNPALVGCDVVAFEEALAAGQSERAVTLYAGPFLDGFFLGDAPEFERWAEGERDRLAHSYARALEGLAEAAERSGNPGDAAEWWKVRATHDPYDSRVALRLMDALERSGNRAGALQHALLHQQRLREDLEIEPAPELLAAVERLRREAAVAVSPRKAKEAVHRPAPLRPAEITAAALPAGNETAMPSSPPGRRSLLWYGGAAILVLGVIGGGIRLASGERKTGAVAAPAVVDEIAQAVARELDRRGRGDTSRMLPQNRTRSIAAYEFYLRGSDPVLLRSDSGARLGLAYFRRAVALDSTYAAAWAGLARMTFRSSPDHLAALAQALVQAEAAARRAVALDDSLAEAHAVLGLIRARAGDFVEAEQHLRRAIALEPGRGRNREWMGKLYLSMGRPAEALAEAERALALEPLSPSATAEVARALMVNDRCDEALALLKTIADVQPPLLRVAPIIAECYGRKRMWAEAIALLRPSGGSGNSSSSPLLGYILAHAGQRDEALAIQARLTDRWRSGTIGAADLAYIPAALGDRDQAFTWLNRALEDGSMGLYGEWRSGLMSPAFDDLRADPRMGRLLARMSRQNR